MKQKRYYTFSENENRGFVEDYLEHDIELSNEYAILFRLNPEDKIAYCFEPLVINKKTGHKL